MCSLDNIKTCRLCAKSAEDFDENFNDLFDKCNKQFLQQIKELTGLTLKNVNKQRLPRHFCKKCKEQLPRACDYRRLIIESQNFFKSKDFKNITGIDNKANKPTESVSQKFDTVFLTNEDFDTKQDLSNDFNWSADNTPAECVEALIEDIKSEDFDMESSGPLPAIELDVEKFSAENLLETNSNSVAASLEENESDTKNIKVIEQKPEEKPNKEESVRVIKVSKLKQKISKEKKIKIPKEKKVREKKPKEKVPKEKKPKVTDGEKKVNQFVCEQCGAPFQSRPGLVAHLLRHTGERKFGCELCEVKFFSIYELQRHMRFHTKEAPYQCRHCERCFRDYSHRQRHERSKHLNLRPFACSLCSKTFTNNYIAKNHMLTHTKLRQFECKICDKYFLRQTHLITHYRSVTHKNNAAKFEKAEEATQNHGEADGWSSELMLKVLNNQQPAKDNTDAT